MRLDDLFQPTANDIILREAILTSKATQDREYITELLPLIPLALWGAGLAWTAYDAYQAKKLYDRGEITGADLGKMVGTDIAITLAAGGVAKVIGKGWKFGKNYYKSKKAAKAAEQASVASAAQAVNKTVKSQVADVVPHSQAVAATTTSKVDKIVSPSAAVIVKGAKKADDVVNKVSSKLPDVPATSTSKVTQIKPHSNLSVAAPVATTTSKVVKKNADAWTPGASVGVKAGAKKIDDIAAKKADDVKGKGSGTKVKSSGTKVKGSGKKGWWRKGFGMGVPGSLHDTNLSQYVNKYGKF